MEERYMVYASPIDNRLFSAVMNSRLDEVINALNDGANIDVQICKNRNDCGYTPLVQAILNGNPDISRELIERGANTEIYPASLEMTVLESAEYAQEYSPNMFEIVELLKGNNIRRNLLAKLNSPPLKTKLISKDHDTNIISQEKIRDGNSVYFIDNDFDPYTRKSVTNLLKKSYPKSPVTREPISNIKHYTAEVKHGGKGRSTRKRKTRMRKTKSKSKN